MGQGGKGDEKEEGEGRRGARAPKLQFLAPPLILWQCFGFIVADMKMLMSVCFTCLCNSTHRKLRCVGNFYRATLCINAVIAVARCSSVRLSLMFVYCIHTVEDVVKLLYPPTILKF